MVCSALSTSIAALATVRLCSSASAIASSSDSVCAVAAEADRAAKISVNVSWFIRPLTAKDKATGSPSGHRAPGNQLTRCGWSD
jgi:hypothetical protein